MVWRTEDEIKGAGTKKNDGTRVREEQGLVREKRKMFAMGWKIELKVEIWVELNDKQEPNDAEIRDEIRLPYGS